jgi:hypothetical protein
MSVDPAVANSYFVESMIMEVLSVILTVGFLTQFVGERYSKNLTALSWFFHRIGLVISLLLLLICIDNLRIRNIMPTFLLSLFAQYDACMLMIALIIAAIAHIKRSRFVLQTFKPILLQEINLDSSLSGENRSTARRPVPKGTISFLMTFNMICGTVFTIIAFYGVNQPWPFSLTLFILLLELVVFVYLCVRVHYEMLSLVMMCRKDDGRELSKATRDSKPHEASRTEDVLSELPHRKNSLSLLANNDVVSRMKFARTKFLEEFEIIQRAVIFGALCVLVLSSGFLHAIYLLISKKDLPADSFENIAYYPQYLPSIWLWEFLAGALFILYNSWDMHLQTLFQAVVKNQNRISGSIEHSGIDVPLVN